jgi:hypothetical protein
MLSKDPKQQERQSLDAQQLEPVRTRAEFARFLSSLARDVVTNPSERELDHMVESLAEWAIGGYGEPGAAAPDWTLLAQIVSAARAEV